MRRPARLTVISLTLLGISAVAIPAAIMAEQNDKYAVKVPQGLAFSEFKGFESWETVGVSYTGETIEVILANPKMIEAYKAGVPGNGKPFPDGAKMAKIHWNAKQSEDAPSPTTVPGALHDVDLMERDSKRFAATGSWGYAQFTYDNDAGKYGPEGTGSDCGYACHTIVQAKDYVFTAYGKR